MNVGGTPTKAAVGKPVTFKDIVVRNGQALSAPAGGIDAGGAKLTLKNCLVTNNTATGASAAGIFGFGTLKMRNTTISKNVGDTNWGGLDGFIKSDIADSKIIGNRGNGTGGASFAGPLNLRDSVVADNSLMSPSGNPVAGIAAGGPTEIVNSTISGNDGGQHIGGLFSEAKLTIRGSTFSGNVGGSGAAAELDLATSHAHVIASKFVNNRAAGSGGAIVNAEGSLIVSRSTFSRNHAAGGNGGAIESSLAALKVSQSTFNDNRAEGGGAIDNAVGPAKITNSTIANNFANFGGGLSGGNYDLNNVSVVRNVAMKDPSLGIPDQNGGGMVVTGSGGFNVQNSLIALNEATNGSLGPDCSGTFTSGGHNLLSNLTGCDGFTGPGDLVSAQPKLGQLANNGGPTKTVALKKGSPAIGAADKSTAEKRDQRGIKRDKHPDIGAFERAQTGG